MTRFRHDPSQSARGFVDNASALPTTPPAPQHHEKQTFDALPKADILTRHGQQAPCSVLHRHDAEIRCRQLGVLKAA